MDGIRNFFKNLFGAKKKVKEKDQEVATVVNLESVEELEVPSEKEKKDKDKEVKAEKKKEPEVRKESKKKTKKPATANASEDSVASDIGKLKTLVKEFSKRLEKLFGPTVSKGLEGVSTSIASVRENISSSLLKKITQAVVVIVLLGIIGFFGSKGLKMIKKDQGDEILETPTPTPVSYRPYKNSIYADDPGVLQMEQDIDILKREVSQASIRETTLNPPSLDFKIAF